MKALAAFVLFTAGQVVFLLAFVDLIFERNRARRWRRFVFSAVAVVCAFWLAGCGLLKPHVVVKTESVEVPRYLRAPLPATLVQPCRYAKPDPACWRDGHREYCNKQLLAIILAQDKTLDDCNDDKAALRALGPEQP